jgi:excisionase family DNA binding protein
MTPSPYMTVEECAAYVRCSAKAVYQRAMRGQLPVKRIGRRLVFDRRSIDACLVGSSRAHQQFTPRAVARPLETV